jgi:hypothetical protein
LCLAAAVVAQSKVPSVLERVQNVDDPELGELIRVALENQENQENQARVRTTGRTQRLELIRKVTLSYTQIKLLDQQVQEVGRKLQANAGPPEMRYELLLAKAELEAKLTEAVANLRELMGIIPKHPFEEQPIESLNTWLRLNPVDGRVYVLDTARPYLQYWAHAAWRSLGLMSEKEALEVVRERAKDPKRLPIRVDILRTGEAAERLRGRVIEVIKECGAQMNAEVSLEGADWRGRGEAPFYVRDGQIRTFYPVPVRKPDGGTTDLLHSGLVRPSELEQHILWRITFRWNLPFTFRIEYDRGGFDTAQRLADEIRQIVKRLDVSDLVDVNSVLVEPIPEAVFLGKWRAMTPGEIQEIEIQSKGKIQLLMRKHSEPRAAMKPVAAPWTLATRDIFIETGHLVMYRGQMDDEGHLVLERGQIFPHGSWHDQGGLPIVFEKLE